MEFRTLFNRMKHRPAPFQFTKPSLTIQEAKEDCDINHIVQLYCGVNPNVNPLLQTPMFAGEDTAEMPASLLDAYEQVDYINERFMQLPSRIREEVGNSPVNMLNWISNPNNYQRGVEIGIFEKPVAGSSSATGNSVVTPERVSVNDTPQTNNNPVTQ